MKTPSSNHLSNYSENEMQVLNPVKHNKMKTQPTQTLPFVTVDRINHIDIPVNFSQQNSKNRIKTEHNNSMFKNNRTNIKQLYNFLKQQAIFVRQKEQIITNIPKQTHNEAEIIRFRQKMVKLLSLKSQNRNQLMRDKETQLRKLRRIQLPKLQDEQNKIKSMVMRTKTRELIPLQHTPNNGSPHKKYADSVNRTSKHRNQQRFQHRPLVISSSKKLSQIHTNPQSVDKPQSSQSQQIVNLKVFKDKKQLNKLSLRLAVQISQKYSMKIKSQADFRNQ